MRTRGRGNQDTQKKIETKRAAFEKKRGEQTAHNSQ